MVWDRWMLVYRNCVRVATYYTAFALRPPTRTEKFIIWVLSLVTSIKFIIKIPCPYQRPTRGTTAEFISSSYPQPPSLSTHCYDPMDDVGHAQVGDTLICYCVA